MKILVDKATPQQLNWLAERALNPHVDMTPTHVWRKVFGEEDLLLISDYCGDWRETGRLIDEKGMSFTEEKKGLFFGFRWNGVCNMQHGHGATAQIAIVRCFVISEFGEEAEVYV